MASIALAQMQPTAASTPASAKSTPRTAAPPPPAPPAPAPPAPALPSNSRPGFKPSVPSKKNSNKLPEINEVMFQYFLVFCSVCTPTDNAFVLR